MSGDIVERLRYAARACNHGFPNGAGDSFPDPTYCGGCLRLTDAADEIERLRRWQAEATAVIRQWETLVTLSDDTLTPHWLGRPKPDLVAAHIATLTAEIERLWAEVGRLTDELQQVASEIALAEAPSLVVIDSVSELMSLHELDPKSDIDVVLMHQLAQSLEARREQ